MTIEGHVAPTCDTQILGWIANRSNLSVPSEVICRDADSGDSLKFWPHVYRPDVAKHLAFDDAFGFAIPLDALPLHWRRVDLLGTDGTPLGRGLGFNLGERVPPAVDPTPAQIFLHIQKTAGTSVRTALCQRLPDSRSCCVYWGSLGLSAPRFMTLNQHQRNMFKFIVGHLYFGIHYFLQQDWRYMTVLRDPLARVLSNFWHHQRYNTQFPGADLPTVANKALSEEFDNYQVRVIAGVSTDTVPLGQVEKSLVDHALNNLRSYFSLVGFVERMDLFEQQLRQSPRFQGVSVPSLNVSDKSGHSTEGLDIQAIKYNNRFDQQLYDEASKMFAN